jgi:hypothetical protein
MSGKSSNVVHLEIDNAAMGQRLDVWLSKQLDLPRGRIGKALKAGTVVLTQNNKQCVCKKPAQKLKAPLLKAVVSFCEPCTQPARYFPGGELDACGVIFIVNKLFCLPCRGSRVEESHTLRG